MKNKKSIFKKLSKSFSNEEIAESYVFPSEVDAENQIKQDKEFQKFRMQKFNEMTPMEYLQAELIRIRFQIETYLHSNKYEKNKNFGYFLSEYIHAIRKSNVEFSKDISLHTSALSRLLNNKELPGYKILIRLELHSNNIIPALIWYRISEKQKEFELLNDLKTRKEEKHKVKQVI